MRLGARAFREILAVKTHRAPQDHPGAKPLIVPQSQTGHRTRVEPSEASAIIVGGGLAGIAASFVLAERGIKVTVIEKQPYLGGRLGAWTDRLATGETFQMERGFHAFFRQYYNLRALMRRVDPSLSCLTSVEDYPLCGPGGAVETFANLPHRAPWNVIELVRRTPRLKLRDLVNVNVRAALAMTTYHPERTYRAYDSMTAKEYLNSLRFPPDARQMLFEVFAHSFFNPEDGMSAADLLMMFHFYFMGNPQGLVFDVLNEPFSVALWAPFRNTLEALGVRFVLDSCVSRIDRQADGWSATLQGSSEIPTGHVMVLAMDVPGLKALVQASPHLDDLSFRQSVASLDVTLPFAVWRLWLDRKASAKRHPFVGTAGLGMLDNISLYETFEGESRRWSDRTGGSVVELHAYGITRNASEAQIQDELRRGWLEVYPEFRDAKVIDSRFLLRQDCPAFAPGAHAERPEVQTPMHDVALAGDFVRLPFPSALMERAVASGVLAANALMTRWNLVPQTVWSIAPTGMLSSLTRGGLENS